MTQLVEVSFSVPSHVADRIDQYAKIAGWSRAELLSRLVCVEVDSIQFDALAFQQEAPKFEKTRKRQVGGQAVLGRQKLLTTPWLTERHGYDPTF